MCYSVDPNAPDMAYFVSEVDDKYGVKISLYSICRGTSGVMKMRKEDYNSGSDLRNKAILIYDWAQRQRCTWKDKRRIPIPDEYDNWLISFELLDDNCQRLENRKFR